MKFKEFFAKTELSCEHCGENLLANPASGIIVTWRSEQNSPNGKEIYQKAYYCCKGECDKEMTKKSKAVGLIYSGWEDLSVYFNPLTYINKNVLWMDAINQGVTFKPAAFDKMINLFTVAFTETSRELTSKEAEEVKDRLENGIDPML